MEPCSYKEFVTALKTLGLTPEDRPTLADIRNRYRRRARKLHPDSAPQAEDAEAIRQLTAAWRLVRSYCDTYRFNLSEEEFYRQNPEAHLLRQFDQDPRWGGLKSEEDS
ncbi:MAG: molecular chaperone DnaJ [Deltaproteobacteria bacterium]|nr:MAG: molecular chaperone DnaJ [Deltaproteobacteria bacterium]